jgi:hypothetical protein
MHHKLFLNQTLLAALALALLAGCSSTVAPPQGIVPAPGLSANSANVQKDKPETPLVERKVAVTRSAFDAVADQKRNQRYSSDPLYKAAQQPTVRSPFDSPFNGNLPFQSFNELRDHVRYGFSSTHEDYKYMDEYVGRQHFNRYNLSAYPQVQSLYKASREDMKRFILLDTLVNSLRVDGRALPYEDVHNPPSQQNYKLLPTEAAKVMPTFGEIVAYNRNSYDVNYSRWDMYRAARYYQSNYARIMAMVMEFGPSRQDCWRLVHREITAYANY